MPLFPRVRLSLKQAINGLLLLTCFANGINEKDR